MKRGQKLVFWLAAGVAFACSESSGDRSSDLTTGGGGAGGAADTAGDASAVVGGKPGGGGTSGQQAGQVGEGGAGASQAGAENEAGGGSEAAGVGGVGITPQGYPAHRPASWDGSIPAQDVCSIDGWCWVDPTPPSNGLTDIWSSSPTDVWMVGKAGTLLHFDGASYRGITNVEHAVGAQGPDTQQVDFVSVRGSSATNVWALSVSGDWVVNQDEQHLFHFDGSKWREAAYPAKIAAHWLWVAGEDDVWLFGEAGKASHWDGKVWLDTPTGTSADLGRPWGFASNDVYVAAPPGVRHWDGKSWQDRSTGIPATVTGPLGKPITNPIAAIWGSSPEDLWATGDYGAYRSQNHGNWTAANPPFVAHDIVGSSATSLGLIGDYADVQWSVWDPQNGATDANVSASSCHYDAIWPASASSYLLVGEQPDLLSIDPADFLCTVAKLDLMQPIGSLDAMPAGVGTPGQLVWAAAPDEVYELDENRNLWKRAGGKRVDTGRGWISQTVAFSARASDDVWLSDTASGKAEHWNGATWTPFTICKGSTPAGVTVNSSGEAFIACDKTLYGFSGSSFESVHTFDASIRGFAGSAQRLWVLTDTLLESSGTNWSSVTLPAETVGRYASLLGADDAGALWLGAVDSSNILPQKPVKVARLLDGSWDVYEPSPGFVDFDGPRSFAVRGNEIWISAWGAGTFRFNGSQFDGYATGCESQPIDISVAGPGEVWLRTYGALLRYRDP